MAQQQKSRSRTQSARGQSARGTGGQTRAKASPAGAKTATPNNASPEEARFIARYQDSLSKSTLRAKWIHSPDEEADRPGQTLATQRREVIEAWAEARGGTPVTVPETERDGRPGVLRMSFRDGGGNGRLE